MRAKTIAATALGLIFGADTMNASAADDPFRPGQAESQATLRYVLALPDGYADDQTDTAHGGKGWPLVLFLHGAGERGDDVNKVKSNGLAKLVAGGKKFPFAVLAPQCPAGQWWSADTLKALVLKAQKDHGFDPDRTYVTGLSMGGFGTWDLITRHGDLFAAAAPVCGGGDQFMAWYNGKLSTLPIWAFHGGKDNLVVPKRSQDMVDVLRFFKNPNVKLTVYPDVGHDSWVKAYDDPELYKWMLSKKRVKPEPEKK